MNVEQLAEVEKLLQLPIAERPKRIAHLIHSDQLDKALRPYIDHPRRVAENVEVLAHINQISARSTADLIAAAWLHDVIEDSGLGKWPEVSPDDLLNWGISPEIILLVKLLTRSKVLDSSKEQEDARYYQAIKENHLARLIKIADMADNCNRQRVKWLQELGKESKVSKYLPALSLFELSEGEQSWFDQRVNNACEWNGLDEEEYLRYFVRHNQLFALGDNLSQARFLETERKWSATFDLYEWIIKLDFDLDQVSLEEAKTHFPEAFPINMKEGN